MNYQQLLDFVCNKMRLAHIYQPLLIEALINAGGKATLRQLAQIFVVQDESQIQFYEQRIKNMPLKVLKKHGIVKFDNGVVSLNSPPFDLEQKSVLKKHCQQQIHDYIAKNGLGLWDYRLLDNAPLPDSFRYQVLKNAKGRCELCGVTARKRQLHVDHIVPRSRGGKTELANLQVLCSKCNCSKCNKDDTDFRINSESWQVQDCPFCFAHVNNKILHENETAFAIKDKYPVSEDHVLVIPKRHVQDYFAMTAKEKNNANMLLKVLKKEISMKSNRVRGFNIGMNCGEVAGQTVAHAHIHLIPRRKGDVENPRGGVRGVIPDKKLY